MDGDADVPDDQKIAVVVDLAEAMGAEVHVHATLDVRPVELEGTPIAAERRRRDRHRPTKIIARVEGVHVIDAGGVVTLAVKTHLAHFFDPSTGDPLR